jgi:hypothetical protein
MKINKENLEWAWKMALTEQVLENDSVIDKSEMITIINETVSVDTIKTYLSEATKSSDYGDIEIGHNDALKFTDGQGKVLNPDQTMNANWRLSQDTRSGLITISIAVLIASAFYVYKNYLTKAARACENFSGPKKEICKIKYKISGCDAAIKKLQSNMKLCKQKKNPEKCASSLNKQIEKWNVRKSKYSSKLNRWQ